MTQIYHAKFRWTENLTLRFIRLRKENGKLFTGRKYSAQAGWEHVLRQMKAEFPTIMADVHYRVLKKKWSNLLQQYKELKNPVHGDKNNADDVSWPFYSAIDEIVSSCNKITQSNQHQQILSDTQLDPHQFLCVSVDSDDQTEEKILPCSSKSSLRSKKMNGDLPDVEISSRKRTKESLALEASKVASPQAPLSLRANTYGVKTKTEMTPLVNVRDGTKLRRTENRSRVPQQQQQQRQQLHIIRTTVNHLKRASQSLDREPARLKRVRKTLVQTYPPTSTSTMLNVNENHHGELIRKLNEFFVYTKRRDEEHRIIMIRILESVEKIASKID